MANNEVKAFLEENPEVAQRLGKKNPTLIDVLTLVSEMKQEQEEKKKIEAEPLKTISTQIPASLYDQLDEVIKEIKQMGAKVKKREIITAALNDYLTQYPPEEIVYRNN